MEFSRTQASPTGSIPPSPSAPHPLGLGRDSAPPLTPGRRIGGNTAGALYTQLQNQMQPAMCTGSSGGSAQLASQQAQQLAQGVDLGVQAMHAPTKMLEGAEKMKKQPKSNYDFHRVTQAWVATDLGGNVLPKVGGLPLQAVAMPVIAPWCESDFDERGAVIVSFVDERLERDGKPAIKQFSGKSGQGQRNYRLPAALPARPGLEEHEQRMPFADILKAAGSKIPNQISFAQFAAHVDKSQKRNANVEKATMVLASEQGHAVDGLQRAVDQIRAKFLMPSSTLSQEEKIVLQASLGDIERRGEDITTLTEEILVVGQQQTIGLTAESFVTATGCRFPSRSRRSAAAGVPLATIYSNGEVTHREQRLKDMVADAGNSLAKKRRLGESSLEAATKAATAVAAAVVSHAAGKTSGASGDSGGAKSGGGSENARANGTDAAVAAAASQAGKSGAAHLPNAQHH